MPVEECWATQEGCGHTSEQSVAIREECGGISKVDVTSEWSRGNKGGQFGPRERCRPTREQYMALR